jgi:hypothetical protein
MSTSADDFFGIDLTAPVTGRNRPVAVSVSEMGQAILSALGGGDSPVHPGADSYEFAVKNQLKIDGVPFALDDDYKHLRPVYEDDWPILTLMAGAQTGKTARLLVHLARTAFGPCYGKMIGYYFPDKLLPTIFSKKRFKPFIRSNPVLSKTLGMSLTGDQKGQDAVLSMNLGETFIYFLTIGGKTSTEGSPFGAVYFDEVRRMSIGDIERAEERLSAQKYKINVKVSTANLPRSDIHRYFLQGDQRYFHTLCGCPEGTVLSLTFPDCIADLRHATPELRRKVEHAFRGRPLYGMSEADRAQYPPAVFVCPSCGEFLVDPRDGYWLPHEENHFPHSYQMPQMLSPTFSAGLVLHKYEGNEDYQEFMNSCLGLAYVDVEKMPVRPEHVDACVNPDLIWGEHMTDAMRRRRLTNCGMGVDVQAGYGIVVIKKLGDNGKHQVVHLEVVEKPVGAEGERTWWYRLGQLMYRYDVALAVIDEAPEFSDSLLFAHAFPGRVFLANFSLGDNAPRTVQWDDESLESDDKQKGRESDQRHRVSMKRTHALHWGVTRWPKRRNEIPPLGTLVQSLPQQGGQVVFSAHLRLGLRVPTAIAHVLREQVSSFVFRDLLEDDPELARQGKKRWVAESLGGHFDFAVADLFASVAVDRIGKPAGIRELGE